jgi:membrane protein implicated in regulation of membrane protease activity
VKQTKFLFDTPVTKDWLFWVFVTLAALSGVSAIQRVSESGGVNTSTFSLLSGFIDALLVIFSTYIFIIPIYLVRKFLRKKNKVDAKSAAEPSQVENESTQVESSGVARVKSKKPFIFVGAGVLVPILIWSAIGNSQSEGDKFFEIEQRISKVVGKWNVAATPIAEAIQLISEGSMGAAEARALISTTSSKFAVIHNELNDECLAIPEYDATETGESGAIGKAYNALRVTCNLIPQQSAEVLFLVSEQISPYGTQERIDYHAEQIQKFRQQRFNALIEALKALRQYGSDGEVAQIDQILSYVENQQ